MMTPQEQRALLVAEVESYTAEIKQNGMYAKGSRGQTILNPSLAARRAALEAIRKLDAQNPAEEVTELDAFLEEEENEEK